MAKKIKQNVKLQIMAGKATPAPPVGPALGQAGINIMEFCKAFNAETQGLEQGIPIPTLIEVYVDKSFSFTTKTPPASFYLKRAANLEKASMEAGREIVGTVTMRQVREIAELKIGDLNTDDLDAASQMIAGSARSMGLEVRE